MAATLIVLAKLFATALMAATCSNIFFAAKNTFCSNFAFLATTFVAAKNDISCSEMPPLAILYPLPFSYETSCYPSDPSTSNIQKNVDSIQATLSTNRRYCVDRIYVFLNI
ncbi:hypothetical protein QL285_002354 [Trifolium repens]|nr:hypothetical protein QL285_002354 [Trifolium repens]